jgi:hypothetical protein
MKIILLLLLSSFTFNKVMGQTTTEKSENSKIATVFFAQCLLSIDNEDELKVIENNLRMNPYVSIVRIDIPTKRLFLLTKNTPTFNLENITSWLGNAASQATCFQIGIYGIDTIAKYPFTNCN